jgi:hypothetical protein
VIQVTTACVPMMHTVSNQAEIIGADMKDAVTFATFAMVMMCFAMFLIVLHPYW